MKLQLIKEARTVTTDLYYEMLFKHFDKYNDELKNEYNETVEQIVLDLARELEIMRNKFEDPYYTESDIIERVTDHIRELRTSFKNFEDPIDYALMRFWYKVLEELIQC